jgi:peptidyl-prolyl cis-trans isomerase C
MMDVYVRRAVAPELTDEKLRGAYREFLDQNPPQEEIHARHILVDTEEKARDIIAQLDDGADFATLAAQSSDGPSGRNGGDLGWFTADTMVPEFSEAAFKLQPGEYTKDPAHSGFGWHVILVEGRRMQDPPTFEEVVANLRDEMLPMKVEEFINRTRADAEIEIFPIDDEAAADEDEADEAGEAGEAGEADVVDEADGADDAIKADDADESDSLELHEGEDGKE